MYNLKPLQGPKTIITQEALLMPKMQVVLPSIMYDSGPASYVPEVYAGMSRLSME